MSMASIKIHLVLQRDYYESISVQQAFLDEQEAEDLAKNLSQKNYIGYDYWVDDIQLELPEGTTIITQEPEAKKIRRQCDWVGIIVE
jgi:hypothetical protein